MLVVRDGEKTRCASERKDIPKRVKEGKRERERERHKKGRKYDRKSEKNKYKILWNEKGHKKSVSEKSKAEMKNRNRRIGGKEKQKNQNASDCGRDCKCRDKN